MKPLIKNEDVTIEHDPAVLKILEFMNNYVLKIELFNKEERKILMDTLRILSHPLYIYHAEKKRRIRMIIAKDGKPFDIEYITEDIREGEVEIIQFLRPNGERRRMISDVGKELAELAENQILSAEELTTGKIAIYSRLINDKVEDEICEIAENGPGDNNPNEILKKLIKRKGGIK